MRKKLSYRIYRIIRWFVWLFYPEIEVIGRDNLPDEPCIVVGNHAQMNGPIAAELYFPVERYTWCAGEMMHLKEVPAYAFKDFWSIKPLYNRWFYYLLSYAVAPISVCIFNNANCIGVYHDMRILSTFRSSVEKLIEGKSLVILPEFEKPYNNIINEFRDKYIEVARMYHKKTGKEVCFTPMYLAPSLKRMYLGKPVRYDSSAPKGAERKRISEYLMGQVTDIARALPEHKVVPYLNISKKLYPSNKQYQQ